MIDGDTTVLSPSVCTSLEKRTLGTSDRWERILGVAEAGALFSLNEDRRPSRLRGGVAGIDARCGTGFVSMRNCGRAGTEGGEDVARGGEFDVTEGGDEGGSEEDDNKSEECGEDDGEDAI